MGLRPEDGLWGKSSEEILFFLPNLLEHYYDNFTMIPYPNPCPITAPTHNLVMFLTVLHVATWPQCAWPHGALELNLIEYTGMEHFY